LGFIHVKITWPDGLSAAQFSVWGSSVVRLIDMGGGGGGVFNDGLKNGGGGVLGGGGGGGGLI